MKINYILVLLLTATLLAIMPDWALAQAPRSLDDELLDDLGADPLDDVDRELFGKGNQDQPMDPSDKADGDLTDRLRRELGTATVPEDENPLLEIARQMRQVEGRIGSHDAGTTTQQLQGRIITDLDELIRQARQRCQSGQPAGGRPQEVAPRQTAGQPQPQQGPGGQNTSNQPPTTSGPRPAEDGPPRRADMAQMQEVMKRLWGHLPMRQREQMIRSSPEEFLPKYELLIEEYYRRLSEAGRGREER